MRISNSEILASFHERTSLDEDLLSGLFKLKDFSRKLKNLLLAKRRIDDNDIYNVTRNVYLQKLADNDNNGIQLLHTALRSFSKTVLYSADAWKEDVPEELLELDKRLWEG